MERPTFEWIISGVLLASILLIIICALIYYIIQYRKEGKHLFTIGKLAIISIFYAFFCIQATLTAFVQPWSIATNSFIPFSIDDVAVIAVGFIFGPIEGLLFGMICDPTNVLLIHHWAFQLLPFFTLPLIGLFSGILGRFYFKKNENNLYREMIFFQIILFFIGILFIIAAPLMIALGDTLRFGKNGGSTAWGKHNNWKIAIYVGTTFGLIMIGLMEIIFFNLWNKKKNDVFMEELNKYIPITEPKNKVTNPDLRLFIYVFAAAAIGRIYGGIISRPYTQHFYFQMPYFPQLILRLIDSSYLIPSATLVSWVVIKYSLVALKTTQTIER